MKFTLEKEITKHKLLIDTIAFAILFATLQALKLINIRAIFFPAKLQAQYQPLIEVMPVSILFTLLGWWCFSSFKDHERLADDVAAGKKQANEKQAKQDTLINWFNARRGEIGRICWVIAFFNLLRAFDHSQQSTVCVIALAVIGAIVQDRAKDLWASWNAKYSNDESETFTPGEYLLHNLLTSTPRICRVVRVSATKLIVRIVYDDDSEGANFPLPIAEATKAGSGRGTLEELRKALKEGV